MIYLCLLIVFANSITNPGLLIAVPFPQTPPVIDLNLPLPIGDTVLEGLELT